MTGCIGIGGVRVDRTVADAIVEAIAPHAIDAALQAAERIAEIDTDRRTSQSREIEEARYEASCHRRGDRLATGS